MQPDHLHPLYSLSGIDDPIEDLKDECPICGSENTFETFDDKLVCRDCWTVSKYW